MDRYSLFLLLAIMGNIAFCQPRNLPKTSSKSPFVLGETISFKSNILNEDRSLNIYLPASYGLDTLREFPVLYLLDGSADEDFIHVAGVVQFGNFPWVNTLPESILVGIGNVDRKRDFTYPTTVEQDKLDYPTTGGSARFIEFLEHELQPFMAKNYRTNDTTTLIGQSLGGLLATEILYKNPTLFKNYLIVSPSLWWDDQSLLKLSPSFQSTQPKVYLAVGKQEHPVMVETAIALAGKLKPLNASLNFKQFESQGHGNIMHLAVYEGLEWLFLKAGNQGK